MPKSQNESSRSDIIIPTTNDLVALRIQALQNTSPSQIRIEDTTDVDEFTKIVNMTFASVERGGTLLPFDDYTINMKSAGMFVLTQDRNTAYVIHNNVFPDPTTEEERQHLPAVQESLNLLN